MPRSRRELAEAIRWQLTADDEEPEPILLSGSGFYLTAFWELHTDRPGGMAAMPIPSGSVERFAGRHQIDGEDFDFLVQMIRAMDAVALEHWRGQEGVGAKPKEAARPLSPELFDALWE